MKLTEKQYLEMQENLINDNKYTFKPSEFVGCKLLLKGTKIGMRVFALNDNGEYVERILLGEVSVDMEKTIESVDMEIVYRQLVFKFVGLVYKGVGLE